MAISLRTKIERMAAQDFRFMQTRGNNYVGTLLLTILTSLISGFTVSEFLGEKIGVLISNKWGVESYGSAIGFVLAFILGFGIVFLIHRTIMEIIVNITEREKNNANRKKAFFGKATELSIYSVCINFAGMLSIVYFGKAEIDIALVSFFLVFSFLVERVLYIRSHAIGQLNDDIAKGFIETENQAEHRVASKEKLATYKLGEGENETSIPTVRITTPQTKITNSPAYKIPAKGANTLDDFFKNLN